MFISYVEGEIGKGLGELTAEDISLYREHLIGTYAAATAAKKLAVLRRFLIFTYMAGATTVNPESSAVLRQEPARAPGPRLQRPHRGGALAHAQRRPGLQLPRLRHARRHGRLRLAGRPRWSGSRSGTSARRRQDQVLLRVLGKGDKVRNVPISPDLWRLIQRFVLLTERSFTSHPDSRKPLFTSRVGKDKPLTTRSVQNIVKKYVRAAGITKAISPHSIRHTVGTNMAVNEAPLLVIQQFLGHSDPKTTMRYIRRAEELATRAYQYNTLPL